VRRVTPKKATPKTPYNPVGDNSRALRAKLKLTLAKVEERCGVKTNLLSMIESGARPNPTLDTLQALASAYNVTVEALITPPDETPPAIPPGLQRLIASRLEGPLTTDELRKLIAAVSVMGVELDATDYAVMLRYLRRRTT
jgi:transcriptional regulator with XRE-family HTH domain